MPWKTELKNNICTIEQLKEYIDLTPLEQRQLKRVIEKHPMSITRYYLSLIDKKEPNDPIRKMVIPSVEEFNLSGSWDPSGEMQITKMPGLQHKYASTALILSTNRCAAYCRYCFRKRLVGLSTGEIISKFDEAVEYINKHAEITNVLISGGDALILPTKIIENFLEKLSKIEHLYFMRIGSKVPVIFPERILQDKDLLSVLKRFSIPDRKLYISTQFNHPRELTRKAIRAINKLIRRSIIINNQTVLLKGVNDDPDIIADLQNKLAGIGIISYYVFQCRPVKRVKQNFQVPIYKGLLIVNKAMKKLNGHSKRFRYVMSHRTGKIEILGIIDDEVYFRYHEARDPKNLGRLFKRKINYTAGWLDEL
ncbi:MAG: KamA family radical SAM protein [bacterium]